MYAAFPFLFGIKQQDGHLILVYIESLNGWGWLMPSGPMPFSRNVWLGLEYL